jgi:hypothetical protein
VTSSREERIAENEVLFRAANERAAQWEERHAEADAEPYYCECAHSECREKISLLEAEYEGVRADSTHFVLVPGHEIPDVETIVEEHEGWIVVEKNPETHHIVESRDERTG